MLGSVPAESHGLGLPLGDVRHADEGVGRQCVSRRSCGNVPTQGGWRDREVVGWPSSAGPAGRAPGAGKTWAEADLVQGW